MINWTLFTDSMGLFHTDDLSNYRLGLPLMDVILTQASAGQQGMHFKSTLIR